MHKFNTLQDVIDLATLAHKKDFDKAGEPYINHPLRVMRAVQDQGARPFVQMAAVLHDVTEDTRFSADILLALGVPDAAVHLVRLLDRNDSKVLFNKYHALALKVGSPLDGDLADGPDFFYYYHIKKNPDARMIKLADIADNMLEWRRSYLPQKDQDRLAKKYADARAKLNA